jgi:hydroxyacylglutathione hydrolase
LSSLMVNGLAVGPLQTNCYIVACEETREAIVVDPGDESERILSAIDALQVQVTYIVNTHGHFDHSLAIAEVKRATNAKFAIHRLDAPLLKDAEQSAIFFMSPTVEPVEIDWLLEDGDIIPVGRSSLKVLHTPGHSPGGICLLNEDFLLSGDTLFYLGVGRTDLAGGDTAQLAASVRTKLYTLPDDVKVYPGHGPASLIGYERENNPFV